jgi:hypothetical protein
MLLYPYLKNVARNPELVAGRNANSRADLELPLNEINQNVYRWSELQNLQRYK